MQIPAALRRRPPERTLEWVARAIGPDAEVVRVRRLRNAWAAAMHAVDVIDGCVPRELVLRRWARTDIPPDIGVVENEVAALTVVATNPTLPAPQLIAADAQGRAADVPAVVMTRLPGRDDLAPTDIDTYVSGLAATLRQVHEVVVPEGVLNYYRPWSLDTVTRPPSWTTRPDVWARAIAIANEPVPAHGRVLVHRDFHPGNVLWQRGTVTGVVDFTHSCRGPAAADIAHCRLNLAQLFGLDVADRFAHAYGPVPDLAWHDITDTVSLGDDTPPNVWRWHDAGRTDITEARLIETIDAFLADAVSRVA